MEEGDCPVCTYIKNNIQTITNSSEPNAFCLHIDINIFKKDPNTKKKGGKKQKSVQNINKFVCALRNTLGGFILIHLSGQDEIDCYLGHFDEAIGPNLRELQQDGDLYINTFIRTWEEVTIDKDKVKVIRLDVRKSDVICTSSFNTKVCTDHENTDATILDVLSLLCSTAGSPDEPSPPVLRTITSGAQNRHENRGIQLKRVVDDKLKELKKKSDYLSSFVDYIWDGLKFKHSLTSMSKVQGGGSFYLGVNELKKNLTASPICEGFIFDFTVDEFKKQLILKLDTEVSVLKRNGEFIDKNIGSLNLISVGKHPADKPSRDILEIAVRYFDGIVFHDKKGPRAYHIKESEICRLEFKEWYDKMKLLANC